MKAVEPVSLPHKFFGQARPFCYCCNIVTKREMRRDRRHALKAELREYLRCKEATK